MWGNTSIFCMAPMIRSRRDDGEAHRDDGGRGSGRAHARQPAAEPRHARADSPPARRAGAPRGRRSEEHTSELQSRLHLVCRLLLEKKKKEFVPEVRLRSVT